MTITRIFRNWCAPATVALALVPLGCSNEEPDEPAGRSNETTSCNPGETVIGSFLVQLEAADSSTQVIGQVKDKPQPANLIWTDSLEDGDCRVQEPSAPFCDPGCGGEVCIEGNTCVPHAVGHSVGEVTIQGVKLQSGETQLVLKEINTNYQAPPGTSYVFPPFAEGDTVEVHAAGGDYPGFDLRATAIAPLELTSTNLEVETGKPLELTWSAPDDPESSSILLKLDISHHGGLRGRIECDTADDGELTISAKLITALIELGVAGFPTIELSRVSRGGASIDQGCVELRVSSFVSHAVSVAGVTSCTDTTCEADNTGCVPCPEGLTCQMDLTCQ